MTVSTPARPRSKGWLGAVAVVLVCAGSARAECARDCAERVAACAATRCAGNRGPARRLCVEECRGRAGCGGGFGTLAYVVTSCRVQGSSQIGTQELRIRREGCDPVTVARVANPAPVSDSAGLCSLLARNHQGFNSPIAGVFQRLGVMSDGSAVVFEISNEFQLVGQTPLRPEEQGFFYVRSDGTGLRRLGPPSRDATYRLFASTQGGVGGISAGVEPEIAFSGDGKTIAWADLGPGGDGVETEQIFALDLRTDERRQVTRLIRAALPPNSHHAIENIAFIPGGRLGFTHLVGDDAASESVALDGMNLRRRSTPPEVGNGIDGRVVSAFGISRRGFEVARLAVPGTPEDPDIHPGETSSELFRVLGRDLIQLTNFHRTDTTYLSARPDAMLFTASGDPFGTNPFRNCQLFRTSSRGGDLRQLTRFGQGARSLDGCQIGELAGCSLAFIPGEDGQRAFLFYSDCDPFGTNPDGGQLFAIDWDGSRLRQLTDTAGVATAADGSLEVEIPGPAAHGGR